MSKIAALKVKIIKCDNPDYWYSALVDENFYVFDKKEKGNYVYIYRVVQEEISYGVSDRYINEEDLEILGKVTCEDKRIFTDVEGV